MRWGRMVVVLILVGTAVGCQSASGRARPGKAVVKVSVVDEGGQPVLSATIAVIGSRNPIEIPGDRRLTINQPVAGTVNAEGYLAEPVIIDPTDKAVTVKLFSRSGKNGVERLSFQFGGDVMLGRRYQKPLQRSDTPVATTDAGARTVVRHIAPIMAAADATTVNLETVVGELPSTGAYPAKRFLLQSPPAVLAALKDLGVDLVTLGNNHAYDWQQAGIESTIKALDGAGIPWTGAGTSAEQAQKGRIIDVRGTKVGIVSATTVNGDFVNDSLPAAEDVKPATLPAQDNWQYDERTFGFGQPTSPNYIPSAARRPGAAWAAYIMIEPTLSAAEAGEVWSAMGKVYPELQDWVARRGHGGAALFQSDVAAKSIGALRAAGAKLVIVEIHGGFQFSDVASDFATRSSHAAIDAGADLVVGHHPHVLQGFEWYNGRLIAYSLGNFVFDQDFLSTFPSAILRTIFEGDKMIDARVIPLVIDRYEPIPVGGAAASRVVRLMDARSALTAYSDRLTPRVIGSVIDPALSSNAAVNANGMTGEITDRRRAASVSYQLDSAGQALLPPCALIGSGSFTGEIGLDLLQWGDMNDVTANNNDEGGVHWVRVGNATVQAEGGNQFMRLQPSKVRAASAHPIARSTTPLHRWFDTHQNPIDGDPSYTVQVKTRGTGVTQATLKVAGYDVNDTDPTTEPVSTLIAETSLPLVVADSTAWQPLSLDVSSIVNSPVGNVRPNAVLVYIELPSGSPRLDVDDVRLTEWRNPKAVPPGEWIIADAIRGVANATVSVQQSGCGVPPG